MYDLNAKRPTKLTSRPVKRTYQQGHVRETGSNDLCKRDVVGL